MYGKSNFVRIVFAVDWKTDEGINIMKTCVKIIQNNVNGKQKQGESNDSVNF
jgi:hypothetical protein